MIKPGFSRLASTSVSASASRPSASVWMVWMVLPLAAVIMSCDLYAFGPVLFSVMASQQSTATGSLSSLMVLSVASATALPPMSICISSMELKGFRLVPPVSKMMPLPTRLTAALSVFLPGRYLICTIAALKLSLPCATARKAPAPSFCSSLMPYFLNCQPNVAASSFVA